LRFKEMGVLARESDRPASRIGLYRQFGWHRMMMIVTITGMPGAGKSTAAQALVAKGWKRVVMGDVIRAETKRRGLEPTAENTGDVMRDLRRRHGDAAVAELCLKTIQESRADLVVVDGIRSITEVETFRKSAKVLLIAVHASPTRRYALLRERGRSDDPLTMDMFDRRDDRELEVGVGKAIALADEVVSNEHNSTEKLSARIIEIVDSWVESLGPRAEA
jgi:dephospho-CoA kinase